MSSTRKALVIWLGSSLQIGPAPTALSFSMIGLGRGTNLYPAAVFGCFITHSLSAFCTNALLTITPVSVTSCWVRAETSLRRREPEEASKTGISKSVPSTRERSFFTSSSLGMV